MELLLEELTGVFQSKRFYGFVLLVALAYFGDKTGISAEKRQEISIGICAMILSDGLRPVENKTKKKKQKQVLADLEDEQRQPPFPVGVVKNKQH